MATRVLSPSAAGAAAASPGTRTTRSAASGGKRKGKASADAVAADAPAQSGPKPSPPKRAKRTSANATAANANADVATPIAPPPLIGSPDASTSPVPTHAATPSPPTPGSPTPSAATDSTLARPHPHHPAPLTFITAGTATSSSSSSTAAALSSSSSSSASSSSSSSASNPNGVGGAATPDFPPISPSWHWRPPSTKPTNGTASGSGSGAGGGGSGTAAISTPLPASSPITPYTAAAAALLPTTHDSLPNALDAWPEIAARLKGRRIAVFLDYDGTLTPIVDTPSEAKLSATMRDTLKQLSAHCPLAIVTGRRISTIVEFVQLSGLHYAGSHGFEIRNPDGSLGKQVAGRFLPALRWVYDTLMRELSSIPGALVEDNKYSISAHYRNVASPEHVAAIERAVDSAIERAPAAVAAATAAAAAPASATAKKAKRSKRRGGNTAASATPSPNGSGLALRLIAASESDEPVRLHKTHGKKVFEVRPAFDWDKGKAVTWLLQTLFAPASPSGSSTASAATAAAPSASQTSASGSASSSGSPTISSATPASPSLDADVAGSDVVAVYIGDDRTDEDAFRVLRARGDALSLAIRVAHTYKAHSTSTAAAAASAASEAAAPPVMTCAEFTVRSVDEVQSVLSRLAAVQSP